MPRYNAGSFDIAVIGAGQGVPAKRGARQRVQVFSRKENLAFGRNSFSPKRFNQPKGSRVARRTGSDTCHDAV